MMSSALIITELLPRDNKNKKIMIDKFGRQW